MSILGSLFPGTEDTTLAVGSAILAFAGLDASLDYLILRVLHNDQIAKLQLSGDQTMWFSDKDRDYPDPMTPKLKRLARLIRKIDSQNRYISHVERAQQDLIQAIYIRDCICHNESAILPLRDKSDTIHLRRSFNVGDVFGYPTKETISFSISRHELTAITSMVTQATMWLHWCVIEIMYDYGFSQRPERPLSAPFPNRLWPYKFHLPPYPWNSDYPTHGIAAQNR